MKVAFLKPPVCGILGLEMLTFVEPLGPICGAACLGQEGHAGKGFDRRMAGWRWGEWWLLAGRVVRVARGARRAAVRQ